MVENLGNVVIFKEFSRDKQFFLPLSLGGVLAERVFCSHPGTYDTERYEME